MRSDILAGVARGQSAYGALNKGEEGDWKIIRMPCQDCGKVRDHDYFYGRAGGAGEQAMCRTCGKKARKETIPPDAKGQSVENSAQTEAQLSREWDQFAEDMIDDLGLGDKAIVDVRSGKLYSYQRQPAEVKRIWKEAVEARENAGQSVVCGKCGGEFEMKEGRDYKDIKEIRCPDCGARGGLKADRRKDPNA